MTRTCIIVSPYFPPSTLAGVHRARHLAKHLPSTGWTPIIVCVDDSHYEERIDPDLAALVPSSVEVVRVPALSRKLSRPIGLGDISLRALLPLRRALMTLLETRRIEAILITGSPYYPMLFTTEIKRRFGVPIVLDFQDPWVSAWGATLASWSKGGLAHRLAVLLEPRAIRSADFITSVSAEQNQELAARYPWLDRNRIAAIPIGGDPSDYDALAAVPSRTFLSSKGSQVSFSYVGTIWPPVLDTVRTLLLATAEVRSRHTDIYERLVLNFIGTTPNPNSCDGRWVSPMAEGLGVAEVVREEPERIPFLKALEIQAGSDAILMLGSSEPHYTASKIYGAMMSGRPYLSVFHALSSSHEILSRAGGGIALSFRNSGELGKLVTPIADALVRLANNPDEIGQADEKIFQAYTAANVARQFASIFDRLTSQNASE